MPIFAASNDEAIKEQFVKEHFRYRTIVYDASENVCLFDFLLFIMY